MKQKKGITVSCDCGCGRVFVASHGDRGKGWSRFAGHACRLRGKKEDRAQKNQPDTPKHLIIPNGQVVSDISDSLKTYFVKCATCPNIELTDASFITLAERDFVLKGWKRVAALWRCTDCLSILRARPKIKFDKTT